jgi:hypothetical protein
VIGERKKRRRNEIMEVELTSFIGGWVWRRDVSGQGNLNNGIVINNRKKNTLVVGLEVCSVAFVDGLFGEFLQRKWEYYFYDLKRQFAESF